MRCIVVLGVSLALLPAGTAVGPANQRSGDGWSGTRSESPETAQPVALFAGEGPAAPTAGDPAVVETHVVSVDRAALNRLSMDWPEAVRVELPSGDVFSLIVTRRVDRLGGTAWTGRLSGVAHSRFTLARYNDTIVGDFDVPGVGIFHLYPRGDVYVMDRLDPARLDGCEALSVGSEEPLATAPDVRAGTTPCWYCDPNSLPDDGFVFDVLVVYTRTLRENVTDGRDRIIARTLTAETDANFAFEQSQAASRIRVVGIREVPFDEPNTLPDGYGSTLLNRVATGDPPLDQVPVWRDRAGADMVTLLTRKLGVCGKGYFSVSHNRPDGQPRWAYNLVRFNCMWNLTMAHELGHNMGCHHATNNSGGVFPYSRGFVDPNDAFYTIMATSNESNGPRRRRWSSSDPNALFEGRPVGDPNHDAARSIDQLALVIANFRSYSDCNCNDIPDECEIAVGVAQDLDGDGFPDACASDCNGNGGPDVCEPLACRAAAMAPPVDQVDLDDLTLLLVDFGKCRDDPGFRPCNDVTHDGCVDLDDLTVLLGSFADVCEQL
jgi:hypothetical protein